MPFEHICQEETACYWRTLRKPIQQLVAFFRQCLMHIQTAVQWQDSSLTCVCWTGPEDAQQGSLPAAEGCTACEGPAQLPHMNCSNVDCNRLFLACPACQVSATFPNVVSIRHFGLAKLLSSLSYRPITHVKFVESKYCPPVLASA